MADRIMNTSVITLTNLTTPTNYTTNAVHLNGLAESREVQESSGGLPVWDQTAPIAQVLLPLSCAVFITIVILIISFCLIKKRASGLRGRKSLHVTDTSDCGIYDVIDEVLAISYQQQDKISRRSDLLSSHFVPSHRREGTRFKPSDIRNPHTSIRLDDGYDVARLPEDFYPQNSVSTVNQSPDRRSSLHCSVQQRLSNNLHIQMEIEKEEDDEERIYETLDKNWKLKYDNECKLQCSTNANSGQALEKPITQLSIPASQVVGVSQPVPTSSDNRLLLNAGQLESLGQTHNKLICQLSVYELCAQSKEMKPIETTYYTVLGTHAKTSILRDSSIYLHMSNLKGISHNPKTSDPNIIRLEPAKNIDRHTSRVCQNYPPMSRPQPPLPQETCTENVSQVTKPYQKLKRVPSSKPPHPPNIIMRKSESFRESVSSSCRLSTASGPRRRSDSFGSKSKQAPFHNPPQTRETARILSKLGPLPPIPSSLNRPHRPLPNVNPCETISTTSSHDVSPKYPILPSEPLWFPNIKRCANHNSHENITSCKMNTSQNDNGHVDCHTLQQGNGHRDLDYNLDQAEAGLCNSSTSERTLNHHSHSFRAALPPPPAMLLPDQGNQSIEISEQSSENHYFILEPSESDSLSVYQYETDSDSEEQE